MNDDRVMTEQLQRATSLVRSLESDAAAQKARVAELEAQLRAREARIQELEKRLPASAPRPATPVPPTTIDDSPVTSESELAETLKRLVTKVAMILQAEKCVFLLHDQKARELFAHRPAFGIADEQVKAFRVSESQGISGIVFQSGKPMIVEDLPNDPRADARVIEVIGARNSASVPLTVERRDEESRVTDRRTIGVLHVFNKRYGGAFAAEDIHLLGVLARNAAAVIANAKLFFEVAEERDKMEATLESISAGLVMVGTNGKIMLMNQSAEVMLGVSEQQEMGGPFEELIADERVKEMLRQALASDRETIRGEITMVIPEPDGGERESIYQAQTALVRSTDTREKIGVALILNDITEIRDVERMKSAFISTVSHELNTPLTSIKGFVSTLRDDSDGFYDAQARQEFYQIIEAECDRLSRLIGNLLNLSRIDAGRGIELTLQPVTLPALIERVVQSQRHCVEGHEIVTRVAPDLPQVVADEAKVDQVLTNLLSNAIKFSPNGGQILIEAAPAGDGVRVSVRDQGIGVAAEHLPRLFDRFHRVDNRDTRETYGAGIGLYLVKHLIEAHGGSVSVESEPGQGATFTFRLPTHPPQS